jgi:hypothetical protein
MKGLVKKYRQFFWEQDNTFFLFDNININHIEMKTENRKPKVTTESK